MLSIHPLYSLINFNNTAVEKKGVLSFSFHSLVGVKSVCVHAMLQLSSSTSSKRHSTRQLAWLPNAVPVRRRNGCVEAVDVKSGCTDSEGWHRTLASVSAPFVSLLAPSSGTANLTTWLADKQLIDYRTAGRGLVYVVRLKDSSDFYILEAVLRILFIVLNMWQQLRTWYQFVWNLTC